MLHFYFDLVILTFISFTLGVYVTVEFWPSTFTSTECSPSVNPLRSTYAFIDNGSILSITSLLPFAITVTVLFCSPITWTVYPSWLIASIGIASISLETIVPTLSSTVTFLSLISRIPVGLLKLTS